ncbi:glycosyl transferase [Cordyceps fumosorosea ARSEF 2679]|uniref:Glycosyl transferase n=1 Tax=Cordyceps fumosorosea (strain ARSEF 2679) TaxID=1081104 RepID=A0A167WJD4_CORFA|nr:glycosyl transferase [Cordyceps fumosorosea ARSEF 2679]OAA63864.1 glycosyl transferase [Cordyceps fumosorosea ARSEF 2679]
MREKGSANPVVMVVQGLLQLLRGSARRALLFRVVLAILLVPVLYQLLPHEAKIFLLSQPTSARCTAAQLNTDYTCPADSAARRPAIPNVLHLVYVLSDPVDGHFPLQFSHFLSVYAAWHRWQPDAIYLHTNVAANSSAVRRARDGESGRWARHVFAMPGLVVNEVAVPTHAGNGVRIAGMEHRSDFVRVQAVHDLGGVYIDMDVHSLKDLRPLREAGYGGVAGKQTDGWVNSGTFMSEPRGRMISLWRERMHETYDGWWTTHSNKALTRVAAELAKAEPCAMLTLRPAAFAPMGWRSFNTERLFAEHFEASPVYLGADGGLPEYPEDYEEPRHAMTTWAHDWRCTFLLHAFSPKKERNGVKDNGISPRFVVERRSNFARAVYPMVRSMYAEGLIDKHDIEMDWM